MSDFMAATRIFIICRLLCMMKENCFLKNTIPTTSQKLPDSRGDVFKRVVLSGPEVWTLQIRNLISYKKKKEREKLQIFQM